MSSSESFTIGFGDNGRNSSRVLHPPGGASSDIFNTRSLAQRPRNVSHLQSSFSLGTPGLESSGPAGVYDVFPEKSVRSPVSGPGGQRGMCGERGQEYASPGRADSTAGAEPQEGEVEDPSAAEPHLLNQPDNQHGDGIIQHDKQTQLGRATTRGCRESRAEGHVQLPREGSRNPITGFGIGVDDTREISSSGGDNDYSGSGRNTGKRMFNTYNKRSQQW
ncbi:hypothetical protein M8J76_007676 [Diaphorina citri]|nr:hypothetical protein M8J76_007676 [Diaphorina citri]KAI5743478.1 hypothetical protein M8J77_018646 [Diaphorina citri]